MLHIPVDLYKTLGWSARILMRYIVTYFQSPVRWVCLQMVPNTVYLAFMDLSLPCEYHKTSLMQGLQRYADNQRQSYKSLLWIRDEVYRKITTRSTRRIHKNEWNTCFRERANDTVTPAILQLPPRTIFSNNRIRQHGKWFEI